MRFMGIDFGAKRIGVAFSDENGRLAFPYTIIPNTPDLMNQISDLVVTKKVSAIVLGESTDMYGKPNKIMGSIESFKHNLEMDLNLPVYYQKEFMTTLEARGRGGKEVNNARKVAKGEQAAADASAAALILQRYLDRKNK